jgi:transglutaminase-like putative cysteine protease
VTEGSTAPTRTIDRDHPRIVALTELVRRPGLPALPGPEPGPLELIRRAHAHIAATVRPVYSVADTRPASAVLRLGRGSCSQRMSVLEAVARATGTPTRVRGLVVDGAFWHARFPRLRLLVPRKVTLAWPEFRVGGEWLEISALFADGTEGGSEPGAAFTNSGAETLFEAVARTRVTWLSGPACDAAVAGGACDLSSYVLADLGLYDSRDELFATHGQALCGPARAVGEPVLGRWSAGAGAGSGAGFRG